MKPLLLAVSALLVCLGAAGRTTMADTNWLRAGIRPWYLGSTQAVPQDDEEAKPPTPIAQAYLVKGVHGETVSMTRYSWSPSMVSTSWLGLASAPADTTSLDEGPFWALPSRLQPLQPGASIQWQGRPRVVTERGPLGGDSLRVALLPARAMLQASPKREMLWLKFRTDAEHRFEDTLLDVQTGLVLYHGGFDDKTKMFLCLSEINYDFLFTRGFPEDPGLHTSFTGLFGGATLGAGAFQFCSQVLTRHKNEVVVSVVSALTGSGSQMSVKSHLLYFNGRGMARITESTQKPPPVEQWQTCGDHGFWWCPQADLVTPQMTVWNTPLHRAGIMNNRTTFSTREVPAAPGFRSLTFDSKGFLSDLAVQNPVMGINVDTTGPCYNRQVGIAGPSEFATMTRASPADEPLSGPSPGQAKDEAPAVALVFGPLAQATQGIPVTRMGSRKTAAGTGLAGLRAEYEAARTEIEQTSRQHIAQSTNIAEQIARGRVLQEELRQLDQHYMDVLDRLQKQTDSATVHNAVDAEKLRVWRIMDGLDR